MLSKSKTNKDRKAYHLPTATFGLALIALQFSSKETAVTAFIPALSKASQKDRKAYRLPTAPFGLALIALQFSSMETAATAFISALSKASQTVSLLMLLLIFPAFFG